MSQFRAWAFWRRLQYSAGVLSIFLLSGALFYFTSFYAPPTCFDQMQNGDEGGIDCDGSCARVCSASTIPPTVVSVKSFKVTDGQYNAVAYVENRNTLVGSPEFTYTFTLLDQGSTIATVRGTGVMPPGANFPIFAGRIATEAGREPTETRLTIDPIELWLPAEVQSGQFRTGNISLQDTDTRPRLFAQIENTELTDARNIEVVATIFDRGGNPLTASQTFIDSLPARSSREVVFTWPNSIAKTVRSCEIPSDIMLVLDRSGSMAGDGGTPPEPLESAKRAAEQFALSLQNNNLLGFVSYATTPTVPIEQTLTSDKTAVGSAIRAVTMGQDGTQFTNMGDAFKVAQEELMSERHRSDARKVIIFLTDGDVTRPVNPETNQSDREYAAAYAKEAAAAAKAADTTIYTIGFGDFLSLENPDRVRDVALIRELASDPSLYFEAPTAAALASVYTQITSGLCEEGPTRIEVVAKPGVTFAPLE